MKVTQTSIVQAASPQVAIEIAVKEQFNKSASTACIESLVVTESIGVSEVTTVVSDRYSFTHKNFFFTSSVGGGFIKVEFCSESL